jgi:hypothetical protein
LKVIFHTDRDAGWQSLMPRADAASPPPWLPRDVAPRSSSGVARAPAFTEAHRTSPARPASTESDVVVPLLQSLITGVIVGLPAGTLITLVCRWPWWSAPAIAVGVIIPAVWLHRLSAHTRALWTVEKIIQRDVDSDGNIGQPDVVELRAEIHDRRQDHHNTIWRVTFPGDLRRLRRFAAAIEYGSVKFSERDALACGYTRFEELRDLFILNGWAEWRDPQAHQQGVTLTPAGESIVEQITNTPLPHASETT